MTVIAWDGKTLAADRRAGDNWLKTNCVTKIHRIEGSLVGASGPAAIIREWFQWYWEATGQDKFPASVRAVDCIDMLVITPDRRIMLYQNTPNPIEFCQEQFAIGSGKEVAMAVMKLGYDARKAVEMACEICPGCGNGIDTLTLEDEE